jgi:hypothetical protein
MSKRIIATTVVQARPVHLLKRPGFLTRVPTSAGCDRTPIVEPVEGDAVLFAELVHRLTACFPSLNYDFGLIASPSRLPECVVERVSISGSIAHFAPSDCGRIMPI